MNTRCWPAWVLSALSVLLLPACSERAAAPDAPAAAGEPLVIQPRASVGPIREGMTTQEVASVFGEPARRTANALIYPQLGLAVMHGLDGKAQVVMCGDVTGLHGPFVKAFRGRTPEGLGMESTREEIIKAFGEPTEAETLRGGQESLRYANQGITFTLQSGKVHHMIVRLHASAGGTETNSIAIDVSPPR